MAAAEACAERGLRVPPEAVAAGLADVRWPGRLEVLAAGPPPVIADGAHNSAGAATLAAALAHAFPARRRLLVLGVSAERDPAAILAPLAPLIAHVYTTAARHPRAAPATTVLAAAQALGLSAELAPDVAAAIERAQHASSAGELIVVAGSLYVVAEARVALGRAAELDPPL